MQGGSFAFLPPVIALMSSQKNFKCENIQSLGEGKYNDSGIERTFDEIWKFRMVNIQGAIIMAGLVEMLIGSLGIIGFILKFVGPLTISPVICLIGLSVMDYAMVKSSENWFLAIFCIIVIIVCSQLLNNLNVPVPCTKSRIPLFGLFPVLFGLLTTYLICVVLTFTLDWNEKYANNATIGQVRFLIF